MRDEEQLRAIWRGQTVTALQMTSQQLRARAAQFESATRRRKLRDLISFALVAVISAFGVLLDNAIVRVGAALLASWALFSMYALHRFGSVDAAPEDSSAQACAVYHQRHLERQRDIALSWPWGIGLAIPGFVLVAIGLGAGARVPNWMFSVVMTGVFLFMYIGLVIYGKMLAQRWQREIDSLRSLRDEPREAVGQ
jgi:hypothetical protein